MRHEYRPRLRVDRKRPVTRKGRYILTVCKTEEDAEAVASFLETMFAAAARDEQKAKAIMEQQRIDAQYEALVQPLTAEEAAKLKGAVGAGSTEPEVEMTGEPQEDE